VLATSVGFVIGLRVADRIGKGLRDSPRDALIALSTPSGESGRAFGFHRTMDTLGAVLGPLVAYAVLSQFAEAFNTVFLVAFVIGVAAVASLGLVKDVVRAVKPSTAAIASPSLPRSARLYLLAVTLLSVGSLPMGVLFFKTQDLGIASATIPLFYAVYNVTYAAFSWPAGRLADRIDTGLVIVLGYGLLIVAYIVLSFASAVWILVVGFLLLGGFSAFTDGVQRSYLSHIVAEEHKGTAFGYLNGAVGLGVLLAGIAGGYLWQHAGDRVTLLVAAGVVLCGLIVFGAGRRFGASRVAAD